MMSRTRMWQIVAVVVSAAGLSLACGVGPRQSAAPPSATAPAVAEIGLSARRLEFQTEVGEKPEEQTVTVTNLSDHELPLERPYLHLSNGIDDGSFREKDDCPSALAEGAHCVLTVTFSPQRAGTVAGWITVADGDGGHQRVTVSGRSAKP